MINGNEYKENTTYDLKNITTEIEITPYKDNKIKIKSILNDIALDDIQTPEGTPNAQTLIQNRNEFNNTTQYTIEKNMLYTIIEAPSVPTIENITSAVKTGVYSTYLDICELARDLEQLEEPTGGILIDGDKI